MRIILLIAFLIAGRSPMQSIVVVSCDGKPDQVFESCDVYETLGGFNVCGKYFSNINCAAEEVIL